MSGATPFITRSEFEAFETEYRYTLGDIATVLRKLESIAMKQQKDIELLEGIAATLTEKQTWLEEDME